MNDFLKEAILDELNRGKSSYQKGEMLEAFNYFERAHILGQKNPRFHTISHIWMLKVAFKSKDYKEILGQLFRIPTGFIGSVLGIVPTGNSGGSNVNPFKRMPVPQDLQDILKCKA